MTLVAIKNHFTIYSRPPLAICHSLSASRFTTLQINEFTAYSHLLSAICHPPSAISLSLYDFTNQRLHKSTTSQINDFTKQRLYT
ncbi:hypothetical protein BC792_1206 [Sphingobacterium allocomposti]|uniref:Uncharacterized protein n=1 Tax=Sphingobacterium allocomposti TaxID=415956 RepID=A0A5S5D7J7_9SPHI|nr:hypothetical protein BC792_1206 [Sphingobacterium composti Yoo et al. 2007 non Ten et al. 2007]